MPTQRFCRFNAVAVMIQAALAIVITSSFCEVAAAQRWAFYTPQQQYRFGPKDKRCSQGRMCNLEINPVGEQKFYSLNFIEFKGNGEAYDRAQIDAALEQLRAAREKNKHVTVFLYFHGWHNSAEERDQRDNANCAERLYTGDVEKFRKCGLEVLAESGEATAQGAAPRVVGIYFAWQGWDFGWPPLVWVPSYYLRMPKARSIGLAGMASATQEIFKEIQDNRDSYFTIAMGHSFGARTLEAALDVLPDKKDRNKYPHAGILQKIRQLHEQRIGGPGDRLPVDLVFYVNAATSHADTIRTQRSWTDTCTHYEETRGCGNDPLYFAVSSRADVLTALVMPVANAVAMPFGYALRGSEYSNGYHLIAAANTPWMQTHNIPVQVSQAPAGPPVEGFCFQVPDPAGESLTYEVTAKPGRAPSLFWTMNSDHWSGAPLGIAHKLHLLSRSAQRQWVISNHGDVWNTGVFNMVRSVIDTQYARLNNPDQPLSCTRLTAGQMLKGRQ